MMNRRPLSLLVAAVLLPSVAWAERTSPLAGQPAIRHKLELRDLRFELVPTFEGTISADFKTTLSLGVKLEYHLTDWLSVGGLFFYGFSSNTGLMDQIVNSLPSTQDTTPTPTRDQALNHANTMPFHGALEATLTPWAGKLSAFGKAFVNYDVYVSGGVAFAQTENAAGDDTAVTCDVSCSDPDPTKHVFNDPRNDGPHNAGFSPGIEIGGGLHIYFSGWGAIDLSVRNYMFNDNPSGLDFNGDGKVDDKDRRFLTHLFVGVGLSFYLPVKPAISR